MNTVTTQPASTANATAAYTSTLSRWHKVAERLSREYTETVFSSRVTLNQFKVSAYLGESQEQFLRDQATHSLAALDRAFAVQDCIVRIRQAVGHANVREGIADQLAELDKLNRRVKVLSELVEGQTNDLIGIEDLHKIPADYVADGERYDSKRPSIKVRVMSLEQLAVLTDQFERTRARSYGLADEISDLNRVKLTVELPTWVAELAGL